MDALFKVGVPCAQACQGYVVVEAEYLEDPYLSTPLPEYTSPG